MIDPRISIDDLAVFLAVAEDEHITAAAARLHRSQPAVTRAVGRVEHRCGVRLFDRPGQRVRLNVFGQVLVEHARRIVSGFDAAASEIGSLLDPAGGSIRLGFLSSLGTWLVPDLIRSFREVTPSAEFVLRQGPFDPVAALLQDGEIDLLLTSPRPRLGAIGWRRLGEERLELAVPAEHRLADLRRVRLSEVAREPFIVLGPTTEFRAISDRLCRKAGFSPTIALETDEVATARALVSAGFGVAILPPLHHPSSDAPPAIAIAAAEASRTFGLAWIAGRRLPAIADALRSWLSQQPLDYG
jgi:DNA-binding transcriptional LysR family regulator